MIDEVTLLLFSRNDIDNIEEIITLYHEDFFEIIVVDSSCNVQHKRLASLSENYRNVNVFRAVPLGTLDPILTYGVSRASGKYIFLLGSDERISEGLLSFIRNSSLEYPAYEIYRLEAIIHEYSLHTRIFRRDRVGIKGYPNEAMEVYGRKFRIAKNANIIHGANMADYFNENSKGQRYGLLESYLNPPTYFFLFKTALSIGFLRPFFLKLQLKNSLVSRYLFWPLYTAIFMKFMLAGGQRFQRSFSLLWSNWFKNSYDYFSGLDEKERKLRLEISMEIFTCGGPSRYLCFDQPEYVESISGSVGDYPSHGEFFSGLVVHRHFNGKCALSLDEKS
ncbi:MAG: hypothetical protein M1431_07855 [Candidatus Thermoplasmatota archaeon]|nr:hypothetical protein [Candidatus Thermoplasmatota archaeon]